MLSFLPNYFIKKLFIYNFCQIFYSKMVNFIILDKNLFKIIFIQFEKLGSFMAKAHCPL